MIQVDPQPPPVVRPSVRPGVSIGRIVLALAVGALWGAGLIAAWMIVMGLATGEAGLGLMLGALAFMIALPLWAAGLLVVGLPAWGVLRVLRLYSRKVAAGVGAALTGAAGALWAGVISAFARNSVHELLTMAPFIAVMALSGAVVGWVVTGVVQGKAGPAR